jgi:hypothetical protein
MVLTNQLLSWVSVENVVATIDKPIFTKDSTAKRKNSLVSLRDFLET